MTKSEAEKLKADTAARIIRNRFVGSGLDPASEAIIHDINKIIYEQVLTKTEGVSSCGPSKMAG